jgi:hypothetical protein
MISFSATSPARRRLRARRAPRPRFPLRLEQLEVRDTPSAGVIGFGVNVNNAVEGQPLIGSPGGTFTPGNLLVSTSVYRGTAATVTTGAPLPGAGGLTAIANGAYPGVFANDTVDASFGVTSPIYLDQLTTSGTPIGVPINLTAALGNTLATSFSSKSELALNLSPDGTVVTFMAYDSPINALDVSNSNTPGVTDPTNLDGLPPVNNPPSFRAVAQIDGNGNVLVTPTTAYSGNNGRAAILGSTGDYYLVGNAGNGGFTIPGSISTNGTTTVTLIPPAGSFTTTAIFQVGDLITGKFIPANATVTGIIDATHFTISAPASAGTDAKAKIVQSGTTLGQLSNNTGVQMVAPGGGPSTTVVGQVNGTFGSSTGYQRGFAVQQTNPLTGLPYGPADKTGKDDNFRGETIFNNTLYVTKGSGGNGIDTVYQVGTPGSLPTLGNAGTTPITVLPGLPAGLATNIVPGPNEFFPFGIWFANSTTLYVADEGSGSNTPSDNPHNDPNAGLEKWSLVGGVWHLDYTLQTGLALGVQYSVANGPHGEIYPAALDPATDGLRNLTGRVNGDGTVTLYAVTSTVSASGDQGADPNKLVAITDNLGFTTAAQAAGESFTTLKTAGYGEVLRGVSFTPVVGVPVAAFFSTSPGTTQYSALINWGDGSPTSVGVITQSGGFYTVRGSHTYGEEGSYTVTTTISGGGATTTLSSQAKVSDPAVQATGGFTYQVTEWAPGSVQALATFTDPGGAEPNSADPVTTPDPYVAMVSWGDGSVSTATLANGGIVLGSDGKTFSVELGHDYARTGNYFVFVTIFHESAPPAFAISSATVGPPSAGPTFKAALSHLSAAFVTAAPPPAPPPQNSQGPITNPAGSGTPPTTDPGPTSSGTNGFQADPTVIDHLFALPGIVPPGTNLGEL